MNAKDNISRTPLHCATENGRVGCVEALLSHARINVNMQNKSGYTPLHVAVENNQIDCMKALLEHKDIHINIQNVAGESALHIAVQSGLTEIVSMLLEHKDINATLSDKSGSSTLDIAQSSTSQHRQEIINLLQHHFARNSAPNSSVSVPSLLLGDAIEVDLEDSTPPSQSHTQKDGTQ